MGYPTLKLIALYERIIKASSYLGDVVLDPFAGSGTTLLAAEQLGRKWIGIDFSIPACNTVRGRFGDVGVNLKKFDTPPTTDCEESEDGGRAVLPDETSNDNETSNETRRGKRA